MDLSIGEMWRGGIEDQCAKMEEHPTHLSKQQLVQLIRSLILVEQVLASLFYLFFILLFICVFPIPM